MSQIPLILRFPKWLSRTLKEEKERKKETAFNLWLACHTQEEIAQATDVPRKTIDDWTGDFGEKLAADNSPFPSDFEVPIYNVWKQQAKTAGVNHFGNSEVRWLENLLYLYCRCFACSSNSDFKRAPQWATA